MTRIIPKRRKKVNEPDQEDKVETSQEMNAQSKSKGGWSLDEVFNSKDITPSRNWKWSGDSFTNEKKE